MFLVQQDSTIIISHLFHDRRVDMEKQLLVDYFVHFSIVKNSSSYVILTVYYK